VSDLHLRQLERLASAGDPDAEATLRLARRRVGIKRLLRLIVRIGDGYGSGYGYGDGYGNGYGYGYEGQAGNGHGAAW